MPIMIMAHLVAGFPDRDGFFQAARALKDGGADILEVQIPFSDPTADGPVITRACEDALREGFRVEHIFDYIHLARQAGFDRVVVMTYANIPFRYGIARYTADMLSAGVEGVLVPDLPLEDEEGFYEASFACGLTPIPVVVLTMPRARLDFLKTKPFSKVYAAIRSGITGQKTEITSEVAAFLDSLTGYERMAGFGIQSRDQIRMLEGHADVAVVGSYFTAMIQQARTGNGNGIYDSVKQGMEALAGRA